MSEKFSWSQLKEFLLSSEIGGGQQNDDQIEDLCCGGAIKVADKQYDIHKKLFYVATNGFSDCLYDHIHGEQMENDAHVCAVMKLAQQEVTTQNPALRERNCYQ
jgi:hypothetical protein